MFTHSKNKKGQLVTVLIAVLLTAQMFNNIIYAQTITPIVTVVPPYSNKLTDYTWQPNKIMAGTIFLRYDNLSQVALVYLGRYT